MRQLVVLSLLFLSAMLAVAYFDQPRPVPPTPPTPTSPPSHEVPQIPAASWLPRLRSILHPDRTAEYEIAADSTSASHRVIGEWIDERSYCAAIMTIYEQSGAMYLEQHFKDGRTLKKRIKQQLSAVERYVEAAEQAISGDYFVIDADGDLELHDADGLITTVKKAP